MDASYVFAGDMRLNPATGARGCCTARGAINPETAVPGPLFESYHREALRRYGQSVILAWHKGTVVGFVNFHPINAAFDNLCPGRDPKVVEAEMQRFRWPDRPSSTLRILCVSTAPAFRRVGLGSGLVRVLIDWTSDWGFRRLHVGANENAWRKPCKPFWEKLGFEVVETIQFDTPRPDGETRLFVMDRDV